MKTVSCEGKNGKCNALAISLMLSFQQRGITRIYYIYYAFAIKYIYRRAELIQPEFIKPTRLLASSKAYKPYRIMPARKRPGHVERPIGSRHHRKAHF